MDKIKEYLYLGLVFITISCFTYNLSFWSKFNFNGLEYLSLSTIITSTIYPLAKYGALYILLDLFFSSPLIAEKIVSAGEGCLLKLLTYGFLLGIVFTFESIKTDWWFLWGMTTGSILYIILSSGNLFHKEVKDEILRARLISLLSYSLAFSFAAGRQAADKIYYDIDFKYVITEKKQNKNSIYKFLSRSETTYVFIDLRNEHLLILNKDSIVFNSYAR